METTWVYVCTVYIQVYALAQRNHYEKKGRGGGEKQHARARLLQRAYFRSTFSIIKINHRYTGTRDGRSRCAVLRYGRHVKRECVVFMKKKKKRKNATLIVC